jgi:hypothetical protein
MGILNKRIVNHFLSFSLSSIKEFLNETFCKFLLKFYIVLPIYHMSLVLIVVK